MCTVIVKTQKPRVAKADIVVYKRAYPQGNDSCVSLYAGYPYQRNELQTTEMTLSDDEGASDSFEQNYAYKLGKRAMYVKEGFHAYTSEARLGELYLFSSTRDCEFIIPKGASYYQNKAGNIVSNQIIFKGYI